MRFERVTIRNYGSWRGEHEFRLAGRGLVLVLGENQDEPRMGSNGSGKSTLFDAIDWCLYGIVPRGDHVDSIVNEAEGADCVVRTDLSDDDGRPVVVERYRQVGKRSGLTLHIDDVERTALDIRETQRLVERAIGMDRETCHATVLFGQLDLAGFGEAKDAERVEILTRILQLEVIDEWLAAAKAERDRLAAEGTQAANEVAVLRSKADTWRQVQEQQVAQREQWEVQHAGRLGQLTEALKVVEAEVGAARAEVPKGVGVLEEQLSALQAAQPVPADTSAIEVEITGLRQEIRGIEARAATGRGEGQGHCRTAAGYRQQKGRMEQTGEGVCSACGQQITPEHVAVEAARLEALAVAAEAEAAAAEARAVVLTGQVPGAERAIRGCQARLEEVRQAHVVAERAHAAQLAHAQAQIAGVQRAQNALEGAQCRAQQAQATLTQERAVANPYAAERAQEELQAIEAEIAKGQAKAKAAEEGLVYARFWVEGFGRSGLKSYIFDSRLAELSDAANEWIGLLTGGTIWVRFESQTMGRAKKTGLANKLNIRVFRHNPDGTVSERGYRSWSGGEKRRVALGIDFGLSRLVAQRAHQAYDLLILDEVFRHLDAAGREAVMDLLQRLRQEKSTILVVDHDAVFAGSFEERVVVRKEGGASKIVEVAA